MPTFANMDVPPPKTCQEFETIVQEAQKVRWQSPNLQKNGRPGQAQEGVDIFGQDEIGRNVGIQCKRYNFPLTFEEVTKEVESAASFAPALSALFIATTAPRDAKLQSSVRSLSEKRVSQGYSAVGLLYWDDILLSLLLNKEVFRVHYPDFAPSPVDQDEADRLVGALELGYFGADIEEFLDLILGEIGWMAHEDPDQVTVILRILERRVQLP